ncbi:glycosyltransferase family 4 protein [Geoalkalibacter subterraneus]|uniref:Glycosyl transferase family 1 n=1 Tax=Geoalkalibacter subterraneus TaxID=483547 RepID=A0A0B5FGS5_9BACT|nr:glycosyltransferase family 1 protein [Geoalkalibacter subterraneus]AJF06508.1 hypothetical protein GSUB_08060 [Geoalkalibacter subterraneus]
MRQRTRITIGVDARTVFCPERRGTGKNLVDLYPRIAELRPDWQFVMYYEQEGFADPFSGIANISKKRIRMKGARWNLWENLRLPLAARSDKVDLLHCPAQSMPRLKLIPIIATIHDIIPLRFDAGGGGNAFKKSERVIRNSLLRSDAVLTVSHFSKSDMSDYFRVNGENIHVLTWAPDSQLCIATTGEIEQVRKKYGINKPYLFTFGATDPRKNTFRVIEAFARMKQNDVDGQLVISGIRDDRSAVYRQKAIAFGVEDDVVFCGFAPDSEIPALLCGAEGLVFASLYEGFGLPLIDAMACNTPALASNVTSLPEVAGDAVLYCDPLSVDSIACGMTEIMTCEKTRARLREQGAKKVKEYTWERTAKTVLNVFEKVLEVHS